MSTFGDTVAQSIRCLGYQLNSQLVVARGTSFRPFGAHSAFLLMGFKILSPEIRRRMRETEALIFISIEARNVCNTLIRL
jgi:hypothetical protein